MKHGLGGTLAGFCTCDEFVFLNSLASVLSAHGLWAADLSDLQSVANSHPVDPGDAPQVGRPTIAARSDDDGVAAVDPCVRLVGSVRVGVGRHRISSLWRIRDALMRTRCGTTRAES